MIADCPDPPVVADGRVGEYVGQIVATPYLGGPDAGGRHRGRGRPQVHVMIVKARDGRRARGVQYLLAPVRRQVAQRRYLLVDTVDTLQQLIVSHHVRFDPEITGSREARIGRSPHRYIWPSELDLMARLAGFELESRWADWDRSAFTGESRSHVSVYRLPAKG